MASITFFVVILLFFSTKANPLQQIEGRNEMVEQNLSLIGDIRYPDHVEGKQGIRFDRYTGSKWPNKTIPYTISSTGFTTTQRVLIRNAIMGFNLRLEGCFRIVPRTNETDYVMVISGNGCYSNLGRVGGQQTLSLQANGCLAYGTIQHEFIHAVGFTHQHNRPDRDSSVRVLYENIPPEWRSQYEKGSSEDFESFGPYDYYSVMHYPINAPGSNKPAFEILTRGIDERRMGQRDGMTDKDARQIRDLYKCSSSVLPIG